MHGSILVIGSVNMDLLLRVKRFPKPGETVLGSELLQVPGGKGANQAVAATRSGARVAFLGCVGDDGFAADLLRVLKGEGIDLRGIHKARRSGSGVALITLDSRGENQIVVSPGANLQLTPNRVRRAKSLLLAAKLVILQREIPAASIALAIELAAAAGVPVIFNPAPAGPVPARILHKTEVLILNETEAETLLGQRFPGRRGAAALVKTLASRVGGGHVVLTRGGKGACLVTSNSPSPVFLPAHRVKVADTTAAGDTFVGAFSAKYLASRDALEAARYAMGAAALCVTRLGAIPSIPRREEIESFLRREGIR